MITAYEVSKNPGAVHGLESKPAGRGVWWSRGSVRVRAAAAA